jgi:predicted transcriptional regulator
MSFKALRVWQILRRHPGVGTRALAEIMGIDEGRLSDSLRLLRQRGCVRGEGTRRGSVFHTEWYAGETEPVDGRGRAPGSCQVLAENRLPWQEALKMANRGRIKRKVKPPKMTAAFSTELERCWPRPRVLRQVGQDD